MMTEPSLTHKNSAPESLHELPVKIARMKLEDVEAVARIERRCYVLPWSPNAYVTEIGNSNAYYTVAKTMEEGVVGYAGMWIIMDEAHLTTIAVDPDVRGRKVGELLLLDLLDYGADHGSERSTLEVREHNKAAHHLYLKYGFEDVAVRKNYYSDNGENAIIMWLNHLGTPDYRAMLRRRRAELVSKFHYSPDI
jgi:ribosomal-protein-alanine N-acetyltransferase